MAQSTAAYERTRTVAHRLAANTALIQETPCKSLTLFIRRAKTTSFDG